MIVRRSLVLAFTAALLASAPAWSQDFPSKPIRLVVGLAAGGGTDLVARAIAPKLAEALGQQVIVENRTGASGIIAADYVAKAPPDGHTLLLAPSSALVANVVMKKKLPYSEKDFAAVSLVGTFHMMLVVNSATPVRNVNELVQYMKAQPNKANVSGSGYTFELQSASFGHRVGSKITFVPFRGTNESVQALLGNEVLMSFADVGPAFGLLKGGQLRALAVTSKARLPEFADVPTFSELGFPELEAEYWMGIFAPSKTNPAIVERLNAELRKVLAQDDVKAMLKARWLEPRAEGAAAVGERVRVDLRKWNAVRANAGLEMAE
jgi:tripartite-type tricarboxylate transporter receptor subunit TctC